VEFIEDLFEDEDITESIMCLRFFSEFDTEVVAEILELVLFEFWEEITRETESADMSCDFDACSLENIDIIRSIVCDESIGFEEMLKCVFVRRISKYWLPCYFSFSDMMDSHRTDINRCTSCTVERREVFETIIGLVRELNHNRIFYVMCFGIEKEVHAEVEL
jgi:hypothetical protein